jgi:ribosomal protein S12 methylthiotransferase
LSKKKKKRNAKPKETEQPAGLPVVGMVSLGCAKNTVDTERVLGMLAERGFPIAADPEWADIVLVNTCSFIEAARDETEATLVDLARERPVVALGCYAKTLRPTGDGTPFEEAKLPGVAFVPFASYDKLPEMLASMAGGVDGSESVNTLEDRACFEAAPRMRVGSPASAYLKVAEGCSNRCSYCSVPGIRGPLASRPFDALVSEAAAMADLGARELCVIAQDTASYGTDIYGRARLAELLRKLCGLKKLKWVRLLYVHPAHLSTEIMEVIASERKMCKYIDLPIQHASDPILKAMGRKHDAAHLREVVTRLRECVPGIAIRTSVIVGFPGEGEDEFRDLLDFVRWAEFDHLGAFTYSRESGTPAAQKEPQVSEATACNRRERVMSLQQEIAFRRLRSRVGGTEMAMLEQPSEDAGVWVARTEREAPDVDGCVLVRAPAEWAPGRLVRATILAREGYDLIARPAGKRGQS